MLERTSLHFESNSSDINTAVDKFIQYMGWGNNQPMWLVSVSPYLFPGKQSSILVLTRGSFSSSLPKNFRGYRVITKKVKE